MRLRCTRIDEWPPLAWLAVANRNDDQVAVLHGPMVEANHEWFCEAVWAGEYAEGDFDRTDILAGTGGRLRDGGFTFVSSGSTVDRLVCWQSDIVLLVSNSIACLLAAKDASAIATYSRYWHDFWTIVLGLKHYKRALPTSIGDLELVYFDNVAWDGRELRVVPKPRLQRDFSSFERYYDFVCECMHSIAQNLAAPARRSAYRMLATISSGYDSATVSVVAKVAGCREAICISPARDGSPEDGAAIAKVLGIEPHVIARDAWRKLSFPQIPFLAADSTTEAMSLQGASSHLRGRILFTGNFGGVMWAKHPPDLGEDIVRGDTSGLSHCEFRLRQGYIQCPVPFWGARQIRDVNRVTLSSALTPWDVPGDYSRPIPRRILETAGVARGMFAVAKRATAVNTSELFTPEAMSDYFEWLGRNRAQWLKRGRLPPIRNDALDRWLSRRLGDLEHLCAKLPVLWRLQRRSQMDLPLLLRSYVFAWAIEHAKHAYQGGNRAHGVDALVQR